MIEDMAIRKLGAKTQHDYVQRVKDFSVFLGRSPDKASKEDLRRYQLHLSESGAHTPKINATVSALLSPLDHLVKTFKAATPPS